MHAAIDDRSFRNRGAREEKAMRKNFRLVHAAQWRFIGWFGLASLLGGGLAVGLFNLLAQRKMEKVLYAMRLPQANTGELLFAEMLYADLAALLFIAAAFALAARRLLAGLDRPLSLMTREIGRVAAGDLRPCCDPMAAGAECGELAAELDGLAASLRQRCQRLQAGSAALRRLEAVELSELPHLRQELERRIDDLKAEVNSLKL
jgi:methyl-accepting chemotaxis protein